MPYTVIEDFRAGLDRRKLPEASPPGSLQKLVNAHINRGGEIEKRLALVAKYALPPGQTFGLAGANGALYTFGSDVSPPVPAGIIYQRLQHPGGIAMNGVVQAEFFDGRLAVIARYVNGDSLLFYDGARVDDWDTGSGVTIVEGKKPETLLTFGEKLYATYSSVVAFSGVATPDDFTTPGAGFKNMANQSAGSEQLTGLGRYQNLMAVFARRNTQIWFMDPDPLQNAKRQDLPNIGAIAARSIESFGEVDVFFLSDTGVRSLRARDSSNSAGVSDVGTPVDDEVVEYLGALSEAEKAAAVAVIDPIVGRYVLSLADRTYVFSHYPSSRISAWSRYDFGRRISEYVSMDSKVWARSGDTVYLLGGDSGKEYDGSVVEVETPYIDSRTVATFKNYAGFDIVCAGEWEVFVNTDPQAPEAWTRIAIVDGTSVSEPNIAFDGHSPLIKLRLVAKQPELAKLAKIIVHYDLAEAA